MKVRYIITWRVPDYQTRRNCGHGVDTVKGWDFEELRVKSLPVGFEKGRRISIYRLPCKVVACQRVEVASP